MHFASVFSSTHRGMNWKDLLDLFDYHHKVHSCQEFIPLGDLCSRAFKASKVCCRSVN